jgi:D-sedoheptulose 7-phosphate isomerase
MEDASATSLAPWVVTEPQSHGVSLRRQLDRRADALGVALVALDAAALGEAAALLVAALRGGRKALVAGNGGSAAEAQHFAGELVGRFRRERAAYAAIALTADTAILTAVANDYGYEVVFARQVEALGQPGDLLLLFSTSGESENLIRAALAGRRRGLRVVAITGAGPNRLARLADCAIPIPSKDTPLIQEVQMIATHLLCELAEAALADEGGA